MKIVWLAPYPLGRIADKLSTTEPIAVGNAGWLVNLAQELAGLEGIELHIVTHFAFIQQDQTVFQDNIHFHVVKYQFPVLKRGFPYYFRLDTFTSYKSFVEKAADLVDSLKPDLVHAHGTEGAYGLAGLRVSEIYPVLTSIQGIIHDIYKFQRTAYFYFQRKLEAKVVRSGNYFGCRTDWDKAFVKKLNKNASILHTPEAINPVFFEGKWAGFTSKRIVVLGTIIKRKGQEDLISILPDLIKISPGIKIAIIGTGKSGYVEYLRKMSARLGVCDSIEWHGHKKSHEIATIFRDSRCLVMPSYSDNSPNAICEAMAAGLPVVAYGTGGIPSIVKHNEDGFLVKTGDRQALKHEILSFFNRDRASLMEISEAAQKAAIQRNLPRNVASATLLSYKVVLDGEKYG